MTVDTSNNMRLRTPTRRQYSACRPPQARGIWSLSNPACHCCWVLPQVTLFIHDLSDIAVDLLKMSNYMQLEGAKHFFLVEATFVINLISWAYLRLWLFPRYVIW